MKIFYTVIVIGLFSSTAFSQWAQTNGPEGGEVMDIVTIDNYIFVNAGAGGIFRSEDNGDHWNAINNGLPKNAHCRAISNTANILYASIDSHGVYKSSDSGVVWSSAGTALQGKTFYSLLADGNDIYAGGSEGGFYHSADGGNTWVKKGSGLGQVRNFAVAGGSLLIAGSTASDGVAVYKSTNKGETLVNLNAPVININRMDSYDNTIYVTGQTLAISRDFGATWSTSTFGGVAISAENDQVILVRGNSMLLISEDEGLNWEAITNLPYAGIVWAIQRKGNTIIVGGQEGIYISENKGISWLGKNEGLNNHIITNLEAADDILFAGTQVGLFSSTDQGVTWNKRNDGLRNNPSEGVAIQGIHINPTNTVIATDKGIFKTLDKGLTWNLKQGVQGGINNSFYVLTGDQERLFACEYGYQYYSSNEGENWTSRSNPAFQDMGILNATVKGDTIVVLAHDKVLISKNFGVTWEAVSVTPGIYFGPNDAIFIEDDLYIASYQGIYKSSDVGAKWKKLNEMTNRSPLSLFHRDNALYAGTTSGVYVSYDAGTTWHALNEGMDIWTGPITFNSTQAFSATYGQSVWRNSLSTCNVRPVIVGLNQNLELNSALDIPIDLNNLQVTDPDDNFPGDFTLTIQPGDNYTITGNAVTPSANYNGELRVSFTINDGHFDSKEYVATLYVVTGIEEPLASFEIFPNPTTQKINFTIKERISSISLKDFSGREIVRFENTKAGEAQTIDVGHLPTGIYFIEMNGEARYTRRFLKY